jgi:hypothetical protein
MSVPGGLHSKILAVKISEIKSICGISGFRRDVDEVFWIVMQLLLEVV